MKKFLIIISMFSVLLMAVSCELTGLSEEDTLKGSLSIDLETLQTKGGTVPATAAEKTITSAYAYIFSGETLSYQGAFTAAELTAKKKTFDNVSVGNYAVYVVANKQLGNITSKAGLEAAAIAFDDNAPTNFVMAGKTDVNVNANAQADCSVTIDRFVGRVRLVSAGKKDGVAGTCTVNFAFLINIPANQNIAGNAPVVSWANLAGRKSGTIVTPATADNPALTYNAYAANSLFYGFANNTVTDQYGAGATAGMTRLSINATWNGTAYWYPVTIANFSRNTNYDVVVTISGPGSNDPNDLVPGKGNIGVTIVASDWDDGGTINGEF